MRRFESCRPSHYWQHAFQIVFLMLGLLESCAAAFGEVGDEGVSGLAADRRLEAEAGDILALVADDS